MTRRVFNSDTLVNYLIKQSVIRREEGFNRYSVMTRQGPLFGRRRKDVLEIFGTFVRMHPAGYKLYTCILDAIPDWPRLEVPTEVTNVMTLAEKIALAVRNESLPITQRLTINRRAYHSGREGFRQALEEIAYDADGIRRSYGLEFEIGGLTAEQEHHLAKLLEVLPRHITERDSSLGVTGVEIVFAPMGKEHLITVVEALQAFVFRHGVAMYNTGMHLTYGIASSDAEVQRKLDNLSYRDLQVRINRFAMVTQGMATQQQLKKVFGRLFCGYASFPQTTTTSAHSNAFSNHGRSGACWECRLPSYRADIRLLVEFLRHTEGAFFGPFNEEDLVATYRFFQSVTAPATANNM